MKFLTLIFLNVVFLFGCTTTPKQYLTQTPIEIKQSDLDDYWVQSKKEFSFSSSTLLPPNTNGFVNIKYLIDSNGQIFNPVVVDSDPSGEWNNIALHALKKLHYINTEKNTQKTPVYVISKFTFNI